MAYDILPSTNYVQRSNLFLVIQHKIPCAITTIKHSSDLLPPLQTPKGQTYLAPSSLPEAQNAPAPVLMGHSQNLLLPHTFFTARCKN